MKIIILNTTLAVADNFTLKEYQKGQIYDVRQSVGCRLINHGRAALYFGKENEPDSVLEPYSCTTN
jgi:hypothetical protein